MSNRNQKNNAIKGRSPLSTQAMPPFGSNELQDAAVWIEGGKYVPKKSMPSLTGMISDGHMSGMKLESNLERLAGVVATGDRWEASTFTLEDSSIELSGYGMSDFTCRGAGATVYGGTELVLKNVDITTRGSGRCATIATEGATLRVYDSRLSSFGGELPPDYEQVIGPGMMEPPWPLKLSGNCRTHLSMDGSRSFFYNCDVSAAAWGAFSTDSSGGCLYLEANDCRVTVTGNGYGTYADNGCHNRFVRCDFKVGNMLAIQDGNSSITLEDCTAECEGCALVLHGGLQDWVDTGIVDIQGGKLTSKEDVLLAKSTAIDIYVKGAELVSENGAVLHSVINDDPMYYERAYKGADGYGVQATFEDMTINGDLIHDDTDRKMLLSLENTTVNGKIAGFPELRFYGNCRWSATADSSVTLCGEVDVSAIDAPAGVTISVRKGEGCKLSGEMTLASGGKLVVE